MELTNLHGATFDLSEKPTEAQRLHQDKVAELRANGKRIDWARWLGRAFWTPHQAVYLLSLFDPENTIISQERLAEMARLIDDFTCDQEAGILKPHASPTDWIAWAQSRGLTIPSQLELLVATHSTKTAKPQGEPVTGDHWTVKARAIADKLALERYKRGEREITQRNICNAVHLKLADDTKAWGTHGPRSAGNIRNVALKEWKFIPPTGTNGTNGTEK